MTPAGRLASVGVFFCSHCLQGCWCGRSKRARKRPSRAMPPCIGELRMTPVWTLFTLWIGLALIASLLSYWLRVSTALTEICVGVVAQLVIPTLFGFSLGTDEG